MSFSFFPQKRQRVGLNAEAHQDFSQRNAGDSVRRRLRQRRLRESRHTSRSLVVVHFFGRDPEESQDRWVKSGGVEWVAASVKLPDASQ